MHHKIDLHHKIIEYALLGTEYTSPEYTSQDIEYALQNIEYALQDMEYT